MKKNIAEAVITRGTITVIFTADAVHNQNSRLQLTTEQARELRRELKKAIRSQKEVGQ